MCHQSVGLIARELEALGIPTISMTSAASITASANAPRGALLDFPLGHTAGRPNLPDEQIAIMRDVLGLYETVTESGTITPLNYTWPGDWKPEARAPIDHRSTRYDTPQYQSAADEKLAVERYGEAIACAVCVPTDVPTR